MGRSRFGRRRASSGRLPSRRGGRASRIWSGLASATRQPLRRWLACLQLALRFRRRRRSDVRRRAHQRRPVVVRTCAVLDHQKPLAVTRDVVGPIRAAVGNKPAVEHQRRRIEQFRRSTSVKIRRQLHSGGHHAHAVIKKQLMAGWRPQRRPATAV